MTVAALVLTAELLYRSVFELTLEDAAALLAPVRLMLNEADAETPERAAMLLAQVAHESCGLKVCVEVWGPSAAQRAYERPLLGDGTLAPLVVVAPGVHVPLWQRLGNVHGADGYMYRGRGWIQLTGRANYHDAGEALGLPLEEEPDLAAQVEVAARVAAWYWRTHRCNEGADAGDLEVVTRRINGGLNGLDLRRKRWAHARAALGLSAVAG